MKDKKATLLLTIMLMIGNMISYSYGMEYGLRFKSHSFPADERTSLPLGHSSYKFEDEFAFGFEMGFYDSNRFGLIYTVTGNDGTQISLVSSAVDGGYQPGIVINDKLNLIPSSFDATPDHPAHPILILKRHENKVIFVNDKDKQRFSFPVDLSKVSSVSVNLGRWQTQASVAPVEIQDVRIFIEKQNTHKWELREHKGDSVYDELNGVLAVAHSPHWILDDHTAWSEIFSLKTDEKIQTAFDPATETFYIVSQERITEFNPSSNTSRNIKVEHDGRVMKFSNHLVFDTISNSLLSYDIDSRQTNSFDFATSAWQKNIDSDSEPRHANHGYAEDGRHAYLFGGYGFYLYNNNLVKLDLRTGTMEDITLHPLPDPRTSASLCVANGRLYLFGGMGNSVGKQEIPSKHYLDLWEYDLETMKGKLVWETDTASYDFLPSQSMYYEEKDTCFYVASTLFGGCMMRISPKRPGYEVVSRPIRSKMDFRDCVFNLYRSSNGHNFYLVIDKRLNDFSHDYAIFRISYPFRDALVYDVYHPDYTDQKSYAWLWWLAGIACILSLAAVLILGIRKKRIGAHMLQEADAPAVKEPQTETKVETEPENEARTNEARTEEAPADESTTEETPANEATTEEEAPATEAKTTGMPGIAAETADDESPAPAAHQSDAEKPARDSERKVHFDRNRSAISLLGTFQVKDNDGADITPKFTARIKDLLIILVLYSEKDEKGVSYDTLDEAIWGDKDEKSAKNNRNVYMRKLRLLLEEVGNVEITYDKGYYRLEPKEGTVVDYHEIMQLLQNERSAGNSAEDLDKTLELLLHGPLLPNFSCDWVDEFKSRFSSTAIQLLTRELERNSNSSDTDLTYKIAETISRHDLLSEEALMIKCRILTAQKMKGVAKNTYDAFCREYKKSYGEEYQTSFSSIIR